MSFDASNMTFNRTSFIDTGVYTATYCSKDSIEEIMTENYFSPCFGADEIQVIPGDFLKIFSYADKTQKTFKIMSVRPVVISSVPSFSQCVLYDLPCAGPFLGKIPVCFYKDIGYQLASFSIYGEFQFVAEKNGFITVQDFDLGSEFIVSFSPYPFILKCFINSEQTILYGQFINEQPYIVFNYEFKKGDNVLFKNSLASYLVN